MKAASEFSAGSRPPQVSSLSQSERWTDGDDRPGKPEREEHQGETVIQRGNTVVSRWEPRLGIKDSTLSWPPASVILEPLCYLRLAYLYFTQFPHFIRYAQATSSLVSALLTKRKPRR